MPVPTAISELSTTPGSNSPSGADSPSVLDDHQRTAYAFIKTLSDAQVALTGNQTIAGTKTFSSPIAGSVTGSAASITGVNPIANGGTGQATAALAFAALKQPASETDSGTVELATTTEASTGTDTTRAVTAAGVEAHMNANELGWSQTWQDLTGSRLANTNYTNSTGRPIVAVVSVPLTNGAVVGWTVGGVGDFGRITNGANAGFNGQTMAIIPAGAVYQLTGNTAPTTWYELR